MQGSGFLNIHHFLWNAHQAFNRKNDNAKMYET